MRFDRRFSLAFRAGAVGVLAMCLSGSGLTVSASEQTQAPQPPPAGTRPLTADGPVLRISLDDAVRMAFENNLGLQTERLNPQIQDFNVARALSAYTPELFGSTGRSSTTAPPTEFLQTGVAVTTTTNFTSTGGVRQQLPWGGRYEVGLNGGRRATDAPRTPYSPQLSSDFAAVLVQPLLRGFTIDGNRANILQAENQQEIVDIQLRERMTQTSRAVRNSYLTLVSAISNLEVSRQSLELAQQQLKNNQRRVEVGAMAPIENVSAEAEVARLEERVIVNEGQIEAAQDALRTLIMNPGQAEFWATRVEPVERPVLTPQAIDVEAAIKNAMANRTDILQLRKQMESADIDIRFNRNQTLPGIDLTARYGMTGVGGTQLRYGPEPEGGGLPEIISRAERPLGDVLRDVFGNDFRNWSFAVNVNYPIGRSAAEASLAAARLRRQQAEVSMRDLEMEISRQVREAARQVQTSLKRVQSTQKARELAERQLEAEEKRVAVGLSDTFRAVQAQRDLASQRFAELNAVIDYNRALIDFEAVQTITVR